MPVAPVTATAGVVLRGFLSERSLPVGLVLVLASLGVGMLLGDASLAREGRIESNLAWVLAELAGWWLALAHGAGLVGRRGVLGAFALARPVPAGLLLAGRFLGLAAGLFLYVAVVSVALSGWLFLAHGAGVAAVLGLGWLLWLRLIVILAVSTLLLALARPTVAATLAALISLAGWLAASSPGTGSPVALKPIRWLASLVVPDLPALDAPITGLPGSFAAVGLELLGPTLYAFFYTAAMIAAAITVFPWRARRPAAPGS